MISKIEHQSAASAVDGGTNQSIARIDLVLSALAQHPDRGLRMADVCRATGLGKATVHRLLSGLTAYRLADLDAETGRYTVGLKILTWASSAGHRYRLTTLAGPSLERLAKRFGDAVYLMVRNGDESVCVARIEGGFPIQSLPMKVGDHRPLGIGAGAAAMLAALPHEEQQRIMANTAQQRRNFPCSDTDLLDILEEASRNGYACVDGKVVAGVCTIGAVLLADNGAPIAAISISSISERMRRQRRSEIAAAIQEEIRSIAESARPLLRGDYGSQQMSNPAA
jgi:DNA-binding IclR family transcriptional regulator